MKEEGLWIAICRIKSGFEYEAEFTTSEMMEIASTSEVVEIVSFKRAEA